MALPLGKIALIVGAGVVGSILAKEDSLPSVSNLFSGAFKIALKGIKQDDKPTSVKKPRNDFLMAQVDSLRQELQILASSRPVTIITATGTRANRFGAAVIVIVVGYGYCWWKGWKVPDFMFATRRSLAEARDTIAKQLEGVYSSVSVTKRHLSSRIDLLDNSIDEFAELTASTRDTITGITSEVDTINANVAFFRGAVENLESKISRIEGKQDITNHGVLKLCDVAATLAATKSPDAVQASSSSSVAAVEFPNVSPPRIASLPPRGLSLELPSPSSSNGSHQEMNGDQLPVQFGRPKSPQSVQGIQAAEGSNSRRSSPSSGFGLFGRAGISNSLFTRTQSLSSAVLNQVRSTSKKS